MLVLFLDIKQFTLPKTIAFQGQDAKDDALLSWVFNSGGLAISTELCSLNADVSYTRQS